ncbi:unnamed protein product [Darwinula stevensoni]|uniref:Protein NDNF n=1 Tax=Darwinula stevensoni TaxID=69355 RepID=A0A7R9A4W5_9CRUS|nr:unnamed protein product [Darwinula stevensoni]CAG0890805.1 unnamed protein product [Darwinula stevensoni]
MIYRFFIQTENGEEVSITVTPCVSALSWTVRFRSHTDEDNFNDFHGQWSAVVWAQYNSRFQRTFHKANLEKGVVLVEVRPMDRDSYVHLFTSKKNHLLTKKDLPWANLTVLDRGLRHSATIHWNRRWEDNLSYCLVMNPRRFYNTLCEAQAERHGMSQVAYNIVKGNGTKTKVPVRRFLNGTASDIVLGCVDRNNTYTLANLADGRTYFLNLFAVDTETKVPFLYGKATIMYQHDPPWTSLRPEDGLHVLGIGTRNPGPGMHLYTRALAEESFPTTATPKAIITIRHRKRRKRLKRLRLRDGKEETATVKTTKYLRYKVRKSELYLGIWSCEGLTTVELMQEKSLVLPKVTVRDHQYFHLKELTESWLELKLGSPEGIPESVHVAVGRNQKRFPYPVLPKDTRVRTSRMECRSALLLWVPSPDPYSQTYCLVVHEVTAKDNATLEGSLGQCLINERYSASKLACRLRSLQTATFLQFSVLQQRDVRVGERAVTSDYIPSKSAGEEDLIVPDPVLSAPPLHHPHRLHLNLPSEDGEILPSTRCI